MSVSADAGDDAATTAINILGDIFCRLIFVLFFIASGIGCIVMTLEGIRWSASADDAGARKKAKESMIHVFVGLIIVLLAIPLVSIVMVGAERFSVCIGYGSAPTTEGPEIVFASGDAKYTTTLRLYEGWNLISVPFFLNDSNVSRVFKGVDYDIIYSWNATSGSWDYYIPLYGGNLTRIKPDIGYWIHVNRNTSLVLLGAAPNVTRNTPLIDGWNLVGFSSYRVLPVGTALESVEYLFVFGWNSTQALSSNYGVGWQFESPSQAYGIRAPPKPPLFRDPGYAGIVNLSNMEPGRGYWIYVYRNESWVYPTNYPL
ncbi:MAG: hypothetical protein FJY77_03180 [Candidatus Altiarchaeales archaeon]|nr:hypothetical protein [Candidatus Altiarchaeales archaeon]